MTCVRVHIRHLQLRVLVFFFFQQMTAYEMRISDWSSDVCSSDLQEKLWVALVYLTRCCQFATKTAKKDSGGWDQPPPKGASGSPGTSTRKREMTPASGCCFNSSDVSPLRAFVTTAVRMSSSPTTIIVGRLACRGISRPADSRVRQEFIK